ncbi:MAG: SRPBCC family protein [Jatrophihabitans sp.]|uniref:SRPBCC family protein n=1 Tax=Jatrophihabitans sp. TaxID=1932789 RepID=UPI003F823597
MTWHDLAPADADFFRTAPIVHRYPVELPVSPQQVWESLQSDASLAAWGLGIKLRWTSPRPFGVGTTREVVMPGGVMTLRERFFRWDEGSGFAFFVEQASRAVFTRFAEDYVVEPAAGGARFTWTIALEPRPRYARLFRVADPLSRRAFSATPRAAKRFFGRST